MRQVLKQRMLLASALAGFLVMTAGSLHANTCGDGAEGDVETEVGNTITYSHRTYDHETIRDAASDRDLMGYDVVIQGLPEEVNSLILDIARHRPDIAAALANALRGTDPGAGRTFSSVPPGSRAGGTGNAGNGGGSSGDSSGSSDDPPDGDPRQSIRIICRDFIYGNMISWSGGASRAQNQATRASFDAFKKLRDLYSVDCN